MRALLLMMLCACSSTGGRSTPATNTTGGGTGGTTGGGTTGGGGDGGMAAVYAHSDSELYSIDPDTLKVTLVGPFQWPDLSDQMTDIAIDKNGLMIGISYDKVYSVDVMTAKCTYLAPLDRSFNGLSFVPATAT